MQNGFIKVAAASPEVKVADCSFNAQQIIKAAGEAAAQGAQMLVTPELGVTGYTCGDLFLQDTLLQSAQTALREICAKTANLEMLIFVGVPIKHNSKLYNCAAAIGGGQVMGFVTKSNLPNYSEFYEARYFTPAFAGVEQIDSGAFRGVPIGVQMLFRCEQYPDFVVAAEICEDLWVPAPPSIFHAAAGATIIANLSASNEVVGKAEWREELVKSHSGKLKAGYVYSTASSSESTTDLVFSGHNIITENGAVLADTGIFSHGMAISEIDLGRLMHERQRITTYPDSGSSGYITAWFSMTVKENSLTRKISPTPFVPQNPASLEKHCEAVLAIQAAGLQKRMSHIGAGKVVLGLSGGLDSSLAILVCAKAFKNMGLSPKGILAVTMPGFGTTSRTKQNALELCTAVGATLMDIDIKDTTLSHFNDISHNENDHSVVYENAQARIRTLTLMDIANQQNAIVIGTGDLSELALGWTTYNGDHMSMYAVNSAVPKTMLRSLIGYAASTDKKLKTVLEDILATPVSPELLPPQNGKISQQTEKIVGPYELHDFFLYYMLRWGFTPAKILRLAVNAFGTSYTREEILEWMKVFFRRFFSQQFKRNCMPDGPKVGSVSLSPRGDWRMPSDAVSSAWIAEIEAL